MRKLLNTLYITREQAYLFLDGENIVCKMENDEKFRMPFDNIENIVCFSYLGVSPALMGKCVEKLIPIVFLSPQGHFLARVQGNTKGNVVLRVQQLDVFREKSLELAQNTVATKMTNCISVIKRSLHDQEKLREDKDISYCVDYLKDMVHKVFNSHSLEETLGLEGNAAHQYFRIFGKLFSNQEKISFTARSKRPPLDPVNAVLSFVYTIFTSEFQSALETVGLDSYIGYYHQMRSGRASLACDLVEETRCIVERFVLTLFNLKILSEKDFDFEASGAVFLNKEGRTKVLTKWQEKKRTDIQHPFLKVKIQFGLLPYVQSNLLAKFVRGEIQEYPSYLQK